MEDCTGNETSQVIDEESYAGFSGESATPVGQDGVFTNAVVWRKLGQCLNFSDLKALRTVCRGFNNLVITETNFKSRALVNLTYDRLESQNFGTTTVLWKNFKIELVCYNNHQGESPEDIGGGGGHEGVEEETIAENDSSKQIEDWISPLLKAAESLTINVAPINVFGTKKRNYPSLDILLEAPDCLKKLALDVNLFDTGENIVFSELSDKIRWTFENLVELEFHIESNGFRIASHHNDSSFTDCTGMMMTVMQNLQVLKVGQIIDEGIHGLPDTVDNELHLKIQNLIRIVEENKTHLTHLHLDDMQLWATPSDNSLQSVIKKDFPSLKSIVIRSGATQMEKKHLMDFFTRLPLLEEIDITMLNQFSNELLALIRQKSTNLKRLRIKTKGFERSEDNMWNFLSKCERLETFQLEFPVSNRFSPNVESHNVILMNLPKSIRCISLNGFFPHTEILTSHDFGNLNPAMITQLVLKKCQEVVDDSTLEWIFKNLLMIQVFSITHNSSITDFGLTGCFENSELLLLPGDEQEPIFSLKNLKGMKSLTIQSCCKITDESLKRAIQFRELKFLDLVDNDCITEMGLQSVISNNPSLEILRTSELDVFPTEEEIRKDHPRFIAHIFADGADSEDGDDSMHHVLDGSDFSGPFDYDDFYDYEGDDYGEVSDYDDDDYGDHHYLHHFA